MSEEEQWVLPEGSGLTKRDFVDDDIPGDFYKDGDKNRGDTGFKLNGKGAVASIISLFGAWAGNSMIGGGSDAGAGETIGADGEVLDSHLSGISTEGVVNHLERTGGMSVQTGEIDADGNEIPVGPGTEEQSTGKWLGSMLSDAVDAAEDLAGKAWDGATYVAGETVGFGSEVVDGFAEAREAGERGNANAVPVAVAVESSEGSRAVEQEVVAHNNNPEADAAEAKFLEALRETKTGRASDGRAFFGADPNIAAIVGERNITQDAFNELPEKLQKEIIAVGNSAADEFAEKNGVPITSEDKLQRHRYVEGAIDEAITSGDIDFGKHYGQQGNEKNVAPLGDGSAIKGLANVDMSGVLGIENADTKGGVTAGHGNTRTGPSQSARIG